ncbi:hypothetical protein NP493_375g00019 [Ridgeia piscesae]|uniref:Death domain-containing protein n=1 Tax=Ridgeia piscesae TaxID=27915 RepID=A0AAD9NTH6_RIDPI|nr:hypothetical protein NP493_375g00019 [Ridgeia piscesae]
MAEEQKNPVDVSGAGDMANGDVVDNPGYLNNKFLLRLAQRIGKDFRQLGIFLEFETHTLEAIRSDNTAVVDCAFDVLKTWKYACKQPDSVTAYETLCDALSELRRNDLVEYVTLGYLNNKFLLRLAQRIGKDFRQLGIFLEFETHTLEAIRSDNTAVVDCAFDVLKTWKYACKQPDSVTAYETLCDALSELRRNDLVEYVTLEAWKKTVQQPGPTGQATDADVVSCSLQASKQETSSQQKEDTDDTELIAARIKILKAAGQPEKGGDDLRRWALNVSTCCETNHQDIQPVERGQCLVDVEDTMSSLLNVAEKGGDDLRRWALNVMHLLRKHNQPDMWTHVAGLIVKNGTLDVSEVITIANIPDLAFLLVSGVACDVTRLDVGGGRRNPSEMWGDIADVTRLCSGVATMTGLRELILFNCQLADDGFGVISDTIRTHCPELTWLNCGRNKGLTSASKNDVRTTLTQLRGLKIGLVC